MKNFTSDLQKTVAENALIKENTISNSENLASNSLVNKKNDVVFDSSVNKETNVISEMLVDKGKFVITSRLEKLQFKKQAIVDSLMKETSLSQEKATDIAEEATIEINKLGLNILTAPIIREIVCLILLKNKLLKERNLYTRLGMPVYDITQLITQHDTENANLQYNPETIHKHVADHVMKEYATIHELPSRLEEAHILGQIHIHDLEYFVLRPFCFSHDLRYFMRYGFMADGTGTHTASANPAKHPGVLISQLTKVLGVSQTNCAGGQGFSYFNTFLAPAVKGLTYKEIKQLMQQFIYEMSQMYVARGGQVVFSSIDCDMSVPSFLKEIPAIQLGGKIDPAVKYKDFEKETKLIFNAILDVYLDGDARGKPFNFPKLEVNLYPDDLKSGKDNEDLLKLSQLAVKFGTPYFVVHQPYMPEIACYQCCAFLMPLADANDESDVRNGTVRGGSLQVVTINLPQAAYDANHDDNMLFKTLEDRLQKAKEVLLLKRDIVKKNQQAGMLAFLNQSTYHNDEKYLEVDKQSYTIGIVGINELVKYHISKEMHESDDAWRFGLEVMKFLKDKISEFRTETGLNFALARTPAETTATRFAKIDLKRFPDKAIVQGDKSNGAVYYSNSFHVRLNSGIPLWKRLQIEGAFHPLTDGGAMTHIWLGEESSDAQAIAELIKKIATQTAIQYFSFTKDMTICNNCGNVSGGLHEKCKKCDSNDVQMWSRITGYYQNIKGWNKGKLQELKDRQRDVIK